MPEEVNRKDEYIIRISQLSNAYGDKLVRLMDTYGVDNLQEITEEQARNFLAVLECPLPAKIDTKKLQKVERIAGFLENA